MDNHPNEHEMSFYEEIAHRLRCVAHRLETDTCYEDERDYLGWLSGYLPTATCSAAMESHL